MNARELHGHFVSMSEERIRDNAGTILRALDLLARTGESTDELVRELRARGIVLDEYGTGPSRDGSLLREAAAAIVALKAERDALKAHAEALHDKLGRFLEFFHGYQSMEWKDSHEVYDAYRAAFPRKP